MQQAVSPGKAALPLSIRLSFWLVGVAIFPLLLALLINEVQSRNTLVNQASTLMETDARTHAQLIDNYLANKEVIIGSLTNDPNVRDYFLASQTFSQAQLNLFIQDGLALEKFLYPEVSLIEFFSPQGKLLLNYSIYGVKPRLHGTDLVPATYLQRVLLGQQFISGVYYDPATHTSTVEVYTPSISATSNHVIGFVRDTLKLDTMLNIVNGEKGANGSGSYAFLLDQNGVRIIDPNPHTLFTAIAPLSPQTQQQIQAQQLYGLNSQKVPVIADQTLQNIQAQSKPPISFQEVPASQQEAFQVARHSLRVVPWTYFVLTPVNVIEAVANQQLLILSLIALLILIPVALIGWIVGKRTSSPILNSVDALVQNSSSLNQLADKEESAASEQVWVVDSSQIGLKSVEYYTKATKKAIWRLNNLSKELPRRRHEGKQEFLQDIDAMVDIGEYLEKAIAYQDKSNQNVSVAITVTDEVANQIVSGARSTKEVADQLDHIVEQLREIVGDL